MRAASRPRFFQPLKDCNLYEAGLRQIQSREAILWYCDTRSGRVVRDQPYAPDAWPWAWNPTWTGIQSQGIQLSFEEASSFVTIDHALTQMEPPGRTGPAPYYEYRIITLSRGGSDVGYTFDALHPAILTAAKDFLQRRTQPYDTAANDPPEWHKEQRRSIITSGRVHRDYRRRSDLDPPHPIFELFDHLIDLAMSRKRF